MSESDPSGLSVKSDESRKVERWRTNTLIDAGYPYAIAQRIAMSAADLHVACLMLTQGCSPETAAEILL